MRKIRGTHLGEVLGHAPTHRRVEFNVIDIIRLKDGQYQEHWSQTDFFEILRQL
ncbi:MAG TPA: ester cyclase [Puia sp.]|uniref:ester cyclase n=1 Tax=Puia sp. TaxID=2045100 RepID=UPI002BF23D71|nr:ester cyclase [Puia sp.]HVU97184.1 ester cyclase [Puia sp.]